MAQKVKVNGQRQNEAYQAGESYGSPDAGSTDAYADLKTLGIKVTPHQLDLLMKMIKSSGEPIDDREKKLEGLISLVSSLPRNSTTRKKLTDDLTDALWHDLQHPPLSYLGDQYEYRSADGSYNNPLQPNLGKAGMPYARTVRKLKHLKGAAPDPGLLFDLLMARTPETFKENPAGISSMLYYHATIIIHDIFRPNRFDSRISDTSSYLDLAPLYGSSLEDQKAVRTMANGKLKIDTFSEKRLIAQPPGVSAILVMYNRFHNYVADILLSINESGRFTLPPTTTPEEKTKAEAKRDEDLFQTARLITNGLYVNITLYDYIRALTNIHHSNSDWTLDPRSDISHCFDADGTPRGIGNQVSAESSLLYRFHSTISLRDEKWMTEFFQGLFPNSKKPIDQLTPQEFMLGLFQFEESLPADPSQRVFGGLKRDDKGKFSDAGLVKILQESMEDPAGMFGPHMVPKALKMIEIADILTARKWKLASLNETRKFYGLETYTAFDDMTSNKEVADLLQKIYTDPDMVEMYPGLFLEDTKPRMDPGSGLCAPYTVSRAFLSDIVTLVRSDRFLTLDYTASTLTNWGMEEIRPDLEVLGGSMFYKLFHRAVPNWFVYNSLHIMQPMYTRKMNEEIAREQGTIDHYTTAAPTTPPAPVVIMTKELTKGILMDQPHFLVPWSKPFREMFGGKRHFETYMLGGDTAAHTAQRKMLYDIIYASPEGVENLLISSATSYAQVAIEASTMALTKDLYQLDIIRDVGIPVLTRLLCNLFNLNLKSPENPNGDLNAANMYKHLINVRTWGFNDLDVAMSWRRRLWAEQGAIALTESSNISIGATLSEKTKPAAKNKTLWDFGKQVVREMAAAGKTQAEIIDINFLTALAGVGVPMTIIAESLEYFLQPANAELWSKLQDLSAASFNGDTTATKTIRSYILEAQRLQSSQRDVRFCPVATEVQGKKFNADDRVILMLGVAGRDATSIPDATKFRPDRPTDTYLSFGWGPHKCLGQEVALAFATSIIRLVAGMKNLRSAPGDMGALKSIRVGPTAEKYYLNDSWSYLTTDPTTWTLHFEGYGKGVYTPPSSVPVTEGRNLDAIQNALKAEAKANSDNTTTTTTATSAKDPAGNTTTSTAVKNGVKVSSAAVVA